MTARTGCEGLYRTLTTAKADTKTPAHARPTPRGDNPTARRRRCKPALAIRPALPGRDFGPYNSSPASRYVWLRDTSVNGGTQFDGSPPHPRAGRSSPRVSISECNSPARPYFTPKSQQCPMSHPNRTLRTELCDRNDRLDEQLRRRVGITVETYRKLSFAFRALGIALLTIPYYASGVQPLPETATIALVAMVLGPDVVEAWLTRGSQE